MEKDAFFDPPPPLAKIRERWAKCLSEFYEFGLQLNFWYNFDGASLGRLAELSLPVKKNKKRIEAKHKGLSTVVGRP